MIPKSQEAIPLRFQGSGPTQVIGALSQVGTAIKLNDQTILRTAEIHHEPADSVLPAKVDATQLIAAQVCPELCLGQGGGLAQLPGA
jgi:hypothetical protein